MSNMVVQTNVMSLNSHRNMKNVGALQSKSSQKLSSGYKVNSAADDAAGLAISEKMRAQIRGLDMASKNSQDAVSLLQTAEGGMQEIDNMLQRVRELTVNVSNDSNEHNKLGTGDRQKMQDEINQLVGEIDSMAERVEFNKKKVLNGEFGDPNDVSGIMTKNAANATDGKIKASDALTKATESYNNALVAKNLADEALSTDEAAGTGYVQLKEAYDIDGDVAKKKLAEALEPDYLKYKGELAAAKTNTSNSNTAQSVAVSKLTGALADVFGDLTGTAGLAAKGATADTIVLDSPPVISAAKLKDSLDGLVLYNASAGAYKFDNGVDLTGLTAPTFTTPAEPTNEELAKVEAFLGSIDTGDDKVAKAFVDAIKAQFGSVKAAVAESSAQAKFDAVDADYIAYNQTSKDNVADLDEGLNDAKKVYDRLVAAKDRTSSALATAEAAKNAAVATAEKASKISGVAVNNLAKNKESVQALKDSGNKPGLYMQVGANADQGLQITIGSVKSDILGIGDGQGNTTIDVLKASGNDTTDILTTLDNALSYVTTERSKLGAAQNRLEYTMKSLDISSENLTSAESRIRDTDMAKEMMNFTKSNVLQQASISMLSQANQAPQSVLKLLG